MSSSIAAVDPSPGKRIKVNNMKSMKVEVNTLATDYSRI